jgi:hypothetical protein
MIEASERCMAALLDTLVDHIRPGSDEGTRSAIRSYVVATVRAMPDYFRLAFRLLALIFDWWSLPTQGRRFHRLDADRRWRQVEAWRNSRFAFQRSMIAFYASFATFGLYSSVYSEDYADGEAFAT